MLGNSSTRERQKVAFFLCDKTSTPAAALDWNASPTHAYPSWPNRTHPTARRCTGRVRRTRFSGRSSTFRECRTDALPVGWRRSTLVVETGAPGCGCRIALANAAVDPAHSRCVEHAHGFVRVDETLCGDKLHVTFRSLQILFSRKRYRCLDSPRENFTNARKCTYATARQAGRNASKHIIVGLWLGGP